MLQDPLTIAGRASPVQRHALKHRSCGWRRFGQPDLKESFMLTLALLVALAGPGAGTAAPPRLIRIDANDFSFSMPDSLAAGVYRIAMTVDGKEPHHAIFVLLEKGKRLGDFLAAGDGPPPAWARMVGGPGGIMPGAPASEATLRLEPGRYAVICMVPSGDGVPHIAKGMSKELVVTGAASTEALPRADVQLKLVDYAFSFSKPLRTGRQVVQVTVPSGQPHEIVVFRLDPGKTAADVGAWGEHPVGPPPGTVVGGIAPLGEGATAQFTLDLAPGTYALICFLPDARDGKPHHVHGMAQQVMIKG
ncbi:MAG: hypothetical protein MUC69_01290 [Gemmatimonadales bacterium]|nr:hypothetical protein [Gemmatimonadales bacterium]